MTDPLYFCECSFRTGTAFIETDRLTNSRRGVVQDIASGQIENVVRVLEVFEDEGSCRDVTEDIAREVCEAIEDQRDGCPSILRDWIDEWCGVSTADRLDAGVRV